MTPNNHRYDVQVLEVHDGDTFTALVLLDFYVRVQVKVRVKDLYTAELRTPAGKEAQRAAMLLLMVSPSIGPRVTIQSYKDQQSFARWLCDVWLPDGTSYKTVMDTMGYGGQGTGT
jgi:hypothetical protein